MGGQPLPFWSVRKLRVSQLGPYEPSKLQSPVVWDSRGSAATCIGVNTPVQAGPPLPAPVPGIQRLLALSPPGGPAACPLPFITGSAVRDSSGLHSKDKLRRGGGHDPCALLQRVQLKHAVPRVPGLTAGGHGLEARGLELRGGVSRVQGEGEGTD